ncbi:hypothetical protein D3C81_837180 [compost metagenome]
MVPAFSLARMASSTSSREALGLLGWLLGSDSRDPFTPRPSVNVTRCCQNASSRALVGTRFSAVRRSLTQYFIATSASVLE